MSSFEDILSLNLDAPAAETPDDEVWQPTDHGQAEPPFLSLQAAADWLGVSLSTIKRLVGTGRLITVRIGARRKVPAGSLAAYVAGVAEPRSPRSAEPATVIQFARPIQSIGRQTTR